MWRLRNRYILLNDVVGQLCRSGYISSACGTGSGCKIKGKFRSNDKKIFLIKVRQMSYGLSTELSNTAPVDSFLKLAIKGATLNGSKSILHLIFEGRKQLDFPVAWLRDNCQCPICFDKISQSRIHDQQLFKYNLSPRDMMLGEKDITIIWDDGHVSDYSREWLCCHSFAENHQRERSRKWYPDRISWNAKDFYEDARVFRKFPVSDVLKHDQTLLEWLLQLARYGISLLTTDANNDSDQLKKIAERVAFIRKTHYGELFSVIGSDDADNVAYKKGALQLHTDLPYYNYTPGIIMLHCIRQSAEGGENILSDGLNAASHLPDLMFQILAKTVVDWIDIGSHENRRFYSLNRDPVLCLNACGELEKVNWSQPQRDSIFNTSVKEATEWYEAAVEFTRIIHDKRNAVKFKSEVGDILTFDNRRILHGRQNYSDAKRLLYGAYIDWDEIYCRIRVLQNMGN